MSIGDLEQLLLEFDDVSSDVANSNSGTFDTNLDRWFEFLDDSPAIAQIVHRLEGSVDFEKWYKEVTATMRSMVGSGDLRWPTGREKRLAMQVALFRGFRNQKPNYQQFDHVFFGNTQFSIMVSEINNQIFRPTARDLRQYLAQTYHNLSGSDSGNIPASDRVVRVNHNDPDATLATKELEKLESAVAGANDIEDPEDKQQALAEIGSMQRLWGSAKIRIEALFALVYRGLKYMVIKFFDNIIGTIAKVALGLIGKVTGLW